VLAPRAPARRPSEASCHKLSRTESSRCRAVYHPHAVSNRHPQRCPRMTGNRHYSRWLRLPRPAGRVLAFFACSRVPASSGPRRGPPRYRIFSMSGSTWPRTPGSTRTARRDAVPVVACRRVNAVGTHPLKFSRLNTFKVGSTRYLYTSPAVVPTHRHAHYRSRRKARYWARG